MSNLGGRRAREGGKRSQQPVYTGTNLNITVGFFCGTYRGDNSKNQRRQRTKSVSTPAPTMPRGLSSSAFMKPFVVLALPGMYLFYKYNQYRRQQQEQNRRKVTERELAHLNHKIVSDNPIFFVWLLQYIISPKLINHFFIL